jgi:hypothetical protein
MSKPSERIKEIQEKVPFEVRDTDHGWIAAVIKYLDEEYEKEQDLKELLRDGVEW